MKILKIQIILYMSEHKIYYKYPKEYDPFKINIIAYGPEEKKSMVRYCIGLTEDIYAENLLKSSYIIEVSREDANILGRKWRPPVLKIINEGEVFNILKKISKGLKLSKEEFRTIDPDDASLGINMNKKFNIDDYFN